MPRLPHPLRRPPKVSMVYERSVARQFLDAGYDFGRLRAFVTGVSSWRG